MARAARLLAAHSAHSAGRGRSGARRAGGMAAGSLLLAGAVPIPPQADTERRSRAEDGAALTAFVRRIVQHHIAQLTTNQGKLQCAFVFV